MITARIGAEPTFEWPAPGPLTVAPTLKAILPSGVEIDLASMVQLHAPVSITAVDSADRAKLTASASVADAAGLQGRLGAAHLVTAERAVYDVQIVEVNGTTIRLAQPLVSLPPLTAAATLYWSTWTKTIPTTVTGARRLSVILRVGFTVGVGDQPTSPEEEEVGLNVVRSPWATGVRPRDVFDVTERLASTVSPSTPEAPPAIRVTGERLYSLLSSALAPRGVLPDDILGPSRGAWRTIHAHLAAAEMLQDDPGASARLLDIVWGTPDPGTGQRLGDGLYAAALRSVQIDTDFDGVADEDPVQVAGPRPSIVGGNFVKRSDPPFKRGAAH